ncbi:hypothetical protein R1sor_024734 [Riccia sorocarpa]|uniref:Uncharacterized protein n=1 Tax=Riccia sorocarpa TaxID=122646 RepID=A0ABD3GRI1_9MARC
MENQTGYVIKESDLIKHGWTTSEWKEQLRALQSNPLVDTLELSVKEDPEIFRTNEEGGPVSLQTRGELWGQFLAESQTVRTLHIDVETCVPVYMSELVSGLRRNPNSAVTSFFIRLSDSSASVYLSEMIRCMRKLEDLWFDFSDWRYCSEDATTALDLASAIADAIQLLNFHYLSLYTRISPFDALTSHDIQLPGYYHSVLIVVPPTGSFDGNLSTPSQATTFNYRDTTILF